MVGSSAVVYGLLLAYGILFGDRVMLFFMIFPMQARYFVMVLGGIELLSSVFYGADGIAHIAHLGGMAFGFLFLMALAAWRQRTKGAYRGQKEAKDRQKRIKKADHLRLVRESDDDDGPKSWN